MSKITILTEDRIKTTVRFVIDFVLDMSRLICDSTIKKFQVKLKFCFFFSIDKPRGMDSRFTYEEV